VHKVRSESKFREGSATPAVILFYGTRADGLTTGPARSKCWRSAIWMKLWKADKYCIFCSRGCSSHCQLNWLFNATLRQNIKTIDYISKRIIGRRKALHYLKQVAAELN